MLRQAWVVIAAVTVIAGVAAGNIAAVALGAFVGLACFAAMLWARYSLRRVSYERYVPEDHAFPDDALAVELRVTNRKRLPLPWLDVRERFPESMVPPDVRDEFITAGQVMVAQTDWRTSVGGFQRVTRDYRLHCPDRGIYELGPGRLKAGDPFGLFTDDRPEDRLTPVVIYPHTVAIEELGLPARRPYGEMRRGLRLFEEPSRVAGVRDYRPGDTLRRVDWNATARAGKLQSRVYDPASSHHLLLCLNTQTLVPAWAGFVPELLERCITVAASIARDAYDRRYSIGMIANGSVPAADRAIRIAPGHRPEQFIRLLEALAVIGPFVLEPLAATLDREEHRLGIGTTIAVITATMPEELASTVMRLKRRGHAVLVLSASGEDWRDQLGDVVGAIDVSHISMPWRTEAWTPGAPR